MVYVKIHEWNFLSFTFHLQYVPDNYHVSLCNRPWCPFPNPSILGRMWQQEHSRKKQNSQNCTTHRIEWWWILANLSLSWVSWKAALLRGSLEPIDGKCFWWPHAEPESVDFGIDYLAYAIEGAQGPLAVQPLSTWLWMNVSVTCSSKSSHSLHLFYL